MRLFQWWYGREKCVFKLLELAVKAAPPSMKEYLKELVFVLITSHADDMVDISFEDDTPLKLL